MLFRSFLSKDGELFVVKIGDKVLSGYTVKDANKDFALILDTATRIEGRVPLSGGETQTQAQQQPQSQQQAPSVKQQTPQQPSYPTRPQSMQPVQPMQQQGEQSIQKSKEQRIQQRRQRNLGSNPSSE